VEVGPVGKSDFDARRYRANVYRFRVDLVESNTRPAPDLALKQISQIPSIQLSWREQIRSSAGPFPAAQPIEKIRGFGGKGAHVHRWYV
jgi:hypothetical protein